MKIRCYLKSFLLTTTARILDVIWIGSLIAGIILMILMFVFHILLFPTAWLYIVPGVMCKVFVHRDSFLVPRDSFIRKIGLHLIDPRWGESMEANHRYGEWVFVTSNSCECVCICTRCGDAGSRVTRHEANAWKYVAADDCKKVAKCKRCADTLERTEHNWGSWRYGTFSNERTCLRCSRTETEEIPMSSTGSEEEDTQGPGWYGPGPGYGGSAGI